MVKRIATFVAARIEAWPDCDTPMVLVSHGETILALRTVLEGRVSRHPLRAERGSAQQDLPNAAVLLYSRVGPDHEVLSTYRWRTVVLEEGRSGLVTSGLIVNLTSGE